MNVSSVPFNAMLIRCKVEAFFPKLGAVSMRVHKFLFINTRASELTGS